jgi:hypothetical protein
MAKLVIVTSSDVISPEEMVDIQKHVSECLKNARLGLDQVLVCDRFKINVHEIENDKPLTVEVSS